MNKVKNKKQNKATKKKKKPHEEIIKPPKRHPRQRKLKGKIITSTKCVCSIC